MKISCNVAGVAWYVVLTVLVLGGVSSRGHGQETFASGKNIAPVYEGWEKNPDGSFNLVFGYFNRNWEEELDIAIGPDNTFEPGPGDRGQPTHRLTRATRSFISRRSTISRRDSLCRHARSSFRG